MREARQALLLVALEHADARSRPCPEDADREEHDDHAEQSEVTPRHAGDEQHRAERREVDERGAEIGLGKDQQHGHEADPDDPEGRLPPGQVALALGQHPCERENEQELPELGRLEGEEAEADPASRAVRRVPDQQDEGDDNGRAREDRAPVAPVEVRVDQRRCHEHNRAHACIQDLAVEVVARVGRDRELRDSRDAPEPHDDERCDAREQDPVDRPGDGH